MATATLDMNLVKANLNMYNKKIEIQTEQHLQDHEMTEDEKKLIDITKDEEFMNKVVAANTPEEVQSLFAGRGVDWTIDEVKDFLDSVRGSVNKILTATDELSDDELTEITGGSFWEHFAKWAVAAVVGVVVGIAIGAATVATGGLGLAIGFGIFAGAVGGVGLGLCLEYDSTDGPVASPM